MPWCSAQECPKACPALPCSGLSELRQEGRALVGWELTPQDTAPRPRSKVARGRCMVLALNAVHRYEHVLIQCGSPLLSCPCPHTPLGDFLAPGFCFLFTWSPKVLSGEPFPGGPPPGACV